MAKKKSNLNVPSWLIWTVVIGVGFLILRGHINNLLGWNLPSLKDILDGMIVFNVFNTADVPIDVPTDPDLTVSISLMPNNICVGESTLGRITSNIPNGICSIFWNAGSGTNLYKNVVLDSSGSWSESNTMSTAGTAIFQVACVSGGRHAVSNQATLTVTSCATTTTVSSPKWRCCMVGREMKCTTSWCNSIQTYNSEAACELQCGFPDFTTTTTVPGTTTTTIPGPPNCNQACMDEVGSPWGGFPVMDPMECEPGGLAIPGPFDMLCCCIMEEPVVCCNCQGDMICMPGFCEQGCFEVDHYLDPDTCIMNCGMPN